jgi:oligopeptide/dipeptide ABC transporter ATP-binding protein
VNTTAPPIPLLEVRNVVQEFVARGRGGLRDGIVHAVSDVSFHLSARESLSIVGESGSGKSTLVRSVLQAPKPKSGQVLLRGTDLGTLSRPDLRRQLRDVQMVFQDPFGSVDAKWKVSAIVEEPLRAFRVGTADRRRALARELLDLVGLDPAVFADRRPKQLSGGQCQRVAIARALAISPALVICDEAVSSLDVLVQAQVLALLERLREQFSLSYLFVAHDLALVKRISDRVAVMYLGKLCEIGPTSSIYAGPLHPYTAALLASVPSMNPAARSRQRADTIAGEPPSPISPPSGCRFRTRCPRAQDKCAAEEPRLRALGAGHSVACHYPLATADRAGKPAPAAADSQLPS